MNPESSGTPAVETTAPASDGASTQLPSTESAEPKEPSLFDRIFRKEKAPADGSQASTNKGQEGREPQKPSTFTLTQDELDRRVQAETDRREAKRAKEQSEAEKARLLDEDPYAYRDLELQERKRQESEAEFTGFLGNVARQFDSVLLDPLMERLPDADRAKLIGDEKLNAGTLDSRKALQAAALDVLVKQAKAEGKAEAEAALRRNPAFRKQVLGEFRRSDEHEEPELVPGAGAAPGGSGGAMTDWMRSSLGRGRSNGSG